MAETNNNEKEIGKLQKNSNTDIVVRIDDYGGKRGITIREFVTGDRYTGFTKAGTRIPADKFLEFRELVNKITLNDLKASESKRAGLVSEKSEKGKKASSKSDDEEIEEVEY